MLGKTDGLMWAGAVLQDVCRCYRWRGAWHSLCRQRSWSSGQWCAALALTLCEFFSLFALSRFGLQACRPDHELNILQSPCAGAFSNWQGMAPGAKIAFQDLGSDNTGTLSVPYDLFYDYFPYNYQWCLPPWPDLLQRPHASVRKTPAQL